MKIGHSVRELLSVFGFAKLAKLKGILRESQVEGRVAEMPKNDYRSNDREFT